MSEHHVSAPDWFHFETCPLDRPTVSVIVPLYRSRLHIRQQIASWSLDYGRLSVEVIYVSDACPNHSHNEVLSAWEQRRSEVKRPIGSIILRHDNGGFAKACNTGGAYAHGEFLCFLNADTVCPSGWIAPMVDIFRSKMKAGIVGNLQSRPDGTIDSVGSEWCWTTNRFQHIGRRIWNGAKLDQPFTLDNAPPEILTRRRVEMVTGCCLMIPRQLFRDVGGFDEGYRIGYWEDAALNMTLREAGYQVWVEPTSRIVHHVGHSGSMSHDHLQANRDRFAEQWIDTRKLDRLVSSSRPKAAKHPYRFR